MATANRVMVRVVDAVFTLLAPLPPIVALSIVSLLTAIAVLIAVRVTSNQPALAAAKRQMYADLLEMRLFNDDLRAMWSAQAWLLRHNAAYLRHAFAPTLWLFVPLALVTLQLDAYFGYAGATLGRPVLITAVLKSPDVATPVTAEGQRAGAQQPDLTLDLPTGIHTETPVIWFAALQQAVWRVVPDAPGDYVIRLRTGMTSYEKTLHVSDRLARRSTVRPSPKLLDQLLYPSERPLPESAPILSIGVGYPERFIAMMRWQLRWISAYTALTIVFFVVLRKPFRVAL